MHSRQAKTISSYRTYFQKWSKLCKMFPEITPLPTEELHFILYILYLMQSNVSSSVIQMSVYAIKYFHSTIGIPIGSSSVFQHILEAAKRSCPRPNNKKKALTSNDILKLKQFLLQDKSLKNQNSSDMFTLIFWFSSV